MSERPPRRRGLGRGLDALLSSTARPLGGADAPDEVALIEVAVDAITPNPEQPRVHFDDAAMAELAASIRVHGVLQPIVVERDGRGGYRLIAGERRLRAAAMAGLRSLPAVARPATETTRQALELALIENLQRADLDPIEEATAYSRLGDAFGLTDEAIGLRVGRSRAAVTNLVRLLALPPAVQQAIRRGALSAGHGRTLLSLADDAAREAMAERAGTEGMSVRDLERAVADALAPRGPADTTGGVPGRSLPAGVPAAAAAGQTGPGHRVLSPDDRRLGDDSLARRLEELLGTPVRIERRRRGGRLVIDFYTDEQLDGLYTTMGGHPL